MPRKYFGYYSRPRVAVRPSTRRSYSSVVRGNRRKVLSSVRRAGGSRVASKTKTMRRPKLDQGVFEERGGSHSVFSHGTRPVPRAYYAIVKNQPKLYYQANQALNLSCTTGVQTVWTGNKMFTDADLINMRKLTSWSATNGSTITPLGYQTQKLFLKDCQSEILITNATNYQCSIRIYDLILKIDTSAGTNSDADNAWVNGYSDETGWDPDTAATGTAAANCVGSTPFSSNLFTTTYKVQKITHTKLAGGQFHTHRVLWRPRRLFNCDKLSSAYDQFRGLTTCTMIVFHGAPRTDNATSATTCACSLNIVSTKNYTFSYIPNNYTAAVQYSGLSTASGTNIMNEATENAEPYEVAT